MWLTFQTQTSVILPAATVALTMVPLLPRILIVKSNLRYLVLRGRSFKGWLGLCPPVNHNKWINALSQG